MPPTLLQPTATPAPDTGTNAESPVWQEIGHVTPDAKLGVPATDGWYTSVKPALDIVVAAVLLVATLPFILVAWALTRLTTFGPGFYVQTRSGLRNKPYQIIKIRSMFHTPAVASNTDWAKRTGDARITPIGRVLRALHLDELPQLINVLRGEMSLVGPRPERPEVIESKQLIARVPGYTHRLAIKPGVTGLAQVQLPADTDLTSVRHKVCYDLFYLANQSIWLDVRICLATLLKSFLGPSTIRAILFLPTREEVCAQFLAFLENSPVEAEAALPVHVA